MLEIAAGKLAAAAASTVLAGGAVVGVSASGDCPAGQEKTVFGCAVVTNYPDEKSSGATGVTSSVTPGSGVVFRDDNGNRTSSGLSNRDKFEWLGDTKPGKSADGKLIKVRQLTQGKGGWGPLYEGWIPLKFVADKGLLNG